MMDSHEIRTRNDEELRAELLETQRAAFNLRMQKATGQLSRPSEFRYLRRYAARLKTVLRERGRT